jgi:hypothetical protein
MFAGIVAKANVELSRRALTDRYRNDPVLWAENFLGVQLWSRQKDILYSIRDNRNTAVAAGHGVGKSFVASIAMAWWVDVHPLDEVMVASTAPFQDQISAILWNNLRVIHNRAKKRFEEYEKRLANGSPLGEFEHCDHALPGYITGDNKWKLHDGTLVGQGRKPPDNKTDSGYQGLHATYLLAIGDEAAGLGSDMIDALGNISTGVHNRLLLIANPTDPSSAMAQIWKKKMPNWVRMHISVFNSPLITGEEGFDGSRAGGMSGQEYVDEKREEWGEDDPRYIARVLGQWAFDSGTNLFTDEELARAANCFVMPDPSSLIYFGADIARSGKDSTALYARRNGQVWECDPETNRPVRGAGRPGIQVRRVDMWRKAPLVGSDPENLGSAERIHAYALAEGARLIMVDAAGLGSGVVDGLNELNNNNYVVVEVWGGAPSTDRRAFLNIRAENYFGLKDKARAGALDLDASDETLFDELRGVVYEYDSKGAVKIESKDDMKRRGVKSPDAADAVWYACMDVESLLDPINQLKPGTQVRLDPAELVEADLYLTAPGMPM